jgi:hypothetical protein
MNFKKSGNFTTGQGNIEVIKLKVNGKVERS